MKPLYARLLLCGTALTLAACSEDIPAGEPGGMGADDLNPPREVGSTPATQILEQVNTPEFSENTRAGSASPEGAIRDSVHP